MGKIFLLLSLLVSSVTWSQSNDYLISMNGVGALKLNMKQAQVEKLLNKKFTLKNMLDKDGSWLDTAKAKYKNHDVTLYFERTYTDDNNENFHMVLAGVRVTNPAFKTREGLTIGADKMKVVNAYEHSHLSISPDFEDDTYTKYSRTKASIFVTDLDVENSLTFFLNNKKVVAIEVVRSYGDGH